MSMAGDGRAHPCFLPSSSVSWLLVPHNTWVRLHRVHTGTQGACMLLCILSLSLSLTLSPPQDQHLVAQLDIHSPTVTVALRPVVLE